MSDIERQLRDALRERAERTEVTAPVVAQAQAGVRRRRRAIATAGAALATAGIVAAVALPRLGGDPVATGPDRDGASQAAGAWRTEYWKDVAVDVPADWGFDAAPYGGDGGDSPIWCHETLPSQGYVGRPIMLSDVCTGGSGNEWPAPKEPYLWFDAPVEPGVVDLGHGYTQETVERAGVLVTVATEDPALRRQILGSVRGGEECLSEVDLTGSIAHDLAPDGGAPTRLRVCGYRATGETPGAEPVPLAYAATYGRETLQAYQDAMREKTARPTGCPAGGEQLESSWVVIELLDQEGAVVQQDVVHLVCEGGVVPGADSLRPAEEWVPLTEATVQPWAGAGTRAVIGGYALDGTGPGEWAWDYFIPMLG